MSYDFVPEHILFYKSEDGLWYARRIACIEHDMDRDEIVYRCDEPVANDCKTLADVLDAAARWEPPDAD